MAQIDRERGSLVAGREAPQGYQGLLEVRDRLAIRRARLRFEPRLPRISDRLVPHLAAEGMVGEPLEVLGQAVGVPALDGLHDLSVQRAPALPEQAAVG